MLILEMFFLHVFGVIPVLLFIFVVDIDDRVVWGNIPPLVLTATVDVFIGLGPFEADKIIKIMIIMLCE